jgi:5-methylcytosine-specific restriction endonuclease McrA
MSADQRDKQRLRKVAKSVREQLKAAVGSHIVTWYSRLECCGTTTGGWFVQLGSLGRNNPRLELWLDRWTRRAARDFYFGFYSAQHKVVQKLMKRLPKHLASAYELTMGDYEKTGRRTWLLRNSLTRRNFNRPVYEHYHGSRFFFGMYHRCQSASVRADRIAARRASAFFKEVLHLLHQPEAPEKRPGIYPRIENRRVVRQHEARERASILAEDCKIRDNYTCQVCGLRLQDVYGELGREFAEAHHNVPLSQLEGEVENTVNDLTTVCPSCHRILHRMDGKAGDIARLRRIVRQHRKNKRRPSSAGSFCL